MPSFTSVNDSVTELSVTPTTARSVTVPGFVTVVVTVTVAVPVTPPLVAVMVAVPAATPVTNPLPLTVATDALLIAHVTGCPVSTFPVESFGVAVNCEALPATTLAEAGLTVTEATELLATLAILPVARVRLSTHMYWSTGEPSPMYGAIWNWWKLMVGRAPVRNRMSCRSITNVPLNQYCATPSAWPMPFTIELI